MTIDWTKYSDEELKRLQDQQAASDQQTNLIDAITGMGTAIAGGKQDAGAYDRNREANAAMVKNYLTQKAAARQAMSDEQAATQFQQGQVKFEQEQKDNSSFRDPNSKLASAARKAMKQMGYDVEPTTSLYDLKRQGIEPFEMLQNWKVKQAQIKSSQENTGDKQINRIETDLAREYRNHPTTKNTNNIDEAYRKIQNAATKPSGAGDLGLIFNYMKMLDPASTVREGEFATAQTIGGIDQKIGATYNRILKGERLTDEMRADFLNRSRDYYNAQLAAQGKIYDEYLNTAARFGANPVKVLGGRPTPAQKETPSSAAPQATTDYSKYQRK